MSGAIASVILRSPFTVAQSGLVLQLLSDQTSDVAETRKGRHWDFTDGGSRASLTVLETHDRPEYHDDLMDAGLTTDDAPEIVVIAYPSKTDRNACRRLAVLVADLLAGLDRGVGDG
ncbi:MAG: hypothetical protein AAF456_18485 [Planctomycetota bacterium]